MRAHMSRVLVISNDFVNQRMAGPAIRSFELSRQLHQAGNEVTLASRAETDLPPQPFPIIAHDTRTLEALGPKHDVILFQGHILDAYPFLAESGACLVADLYGPFTLELLVLRPLQPTVNDLPDWDQTLSVVDDQLRLSDYFLCASEKQFDYWVGALSALNRINPQTFARDPSMRSLIDLVPFGLPEEPPVKRAPAMRGVIPGIGDNDLILLAGTIYNWLDPLTLIRGVATASRRHPELRLVFMGTAHPNRYAPKFWMIATARRLAEELGLLNRVVFLTRTGFPTRIAPTGCSRPTSACRPIPTISRPGMPSVPASSISSGPGCPSCAPQETPWGIPSNSVGWGSRCSPATRMPSRPPSRCWPTQRRGANAPNGWRPMRPSSPGQRSPLR